VCGETKAWGTNHSRDLRVGHRVFLGYRRLYHYLV